MLIIPLQIVQGLRGTFVDMLHTAIDPLPDTFVGYPPASAGRRNLATEAALYAQGRTTPGQIVTWAKPGDSAHLFGWALDVALKSPAGTMTWDYTDPAWLRLWTAIRAAPSLHSGQDFPAGEADGAHIERLNWREYE